MRIGASYLIQSARKRAHLWAMLRPVWKKQTLTMSMSRFLVLVRRPSFPSLGLETNRGGGLGSEETYASSLDFDTKITVTIILRCNRCI